MKSILILFLFLSVTSFAQSGLKGVVKDKKGKPVFAANVYLKSSPQKGVITDFNGRFSLQISNRKDTLIVSFIGFQTKKIPLASIDLNKQLVVILKKNTQSLEEVIISAQDPISKHFSVVKMNKLDIYFNPVSQGDPLKAITIIPASTTTDETANPSLRGSSADRSRVLLNGVPIYDPVRASQLNNQGFFSLFNPEIIDEMYVYASNPPLTSGNTSAGLVQIQTKKNIETNQLQLSASLGSAGLFLSQKIKKDVSFIQAYGNFQFSNAFVGIQRKDLPDIKNFQTRDAGLNFHSKIGKRSAFNSFNYFIDERFNGVNELFTYKGAINATNKRYFTVNNLEYYTHKGVFSINNGINISKKDFSFGNIKSENRDYQIYTSVNYKWFVLDNTNLQFGITQDYHRDEFNDRNPVYYYALSPNSQSFKSDTTISNNNLEAYFYINWDINDKWTFSSGMRSNIPTRNQKYYFSSQFGLKYQLNSQQSFLLGGGRYHNYATPSYYSQKYNLLSSYQIALDYSYKLKNTLIKAATYFTNETGGQQTSNSFFEINKINTFGIEFSLEQNFYKYFKFTFSNSFINQSMEINNKAYKGPKDFNYLVKTTIQYFNPKLFSLSLAYIGRPGTFYTPIVNSTLDYQTDFYKPVFSQNLYSSQYGNYNRIDVSLSRYFKLKNNNAFIAFISLNNVLNNKNERQIFYTTNYPAHHFNYYQLRIVYFGIVWHLNY